MAHFNPIQTSGALYHDPIYPFPNSEKLPGLPGTKNPGPGGAVSTREDYPLLEGQKLLPDGSVELCLYEPDAKEVLLCGVGTSFRGGPYPMEKHPDGTFRRTFSGLRPGTHHYDYQVDGVRKLNRRAPVVYGCSDLVNVLEVPGEGQELFELRDVPHGSVRFELFSSEMLSRPCGAWVYTPPGYDTHPEKRYPVFYLQHGGGENEAAWIWTARVNYLADNLIAQGKMKEMLIICCNGFSRVREPDGRGRNASFEEQMVREIIPWADRTFRTIPDRLSRAMAGLSMGAGQSRYIVHHHPELFAWLGQFSSGAGFVIQSETGYYGRPVDYSELFSDPERYNERMKLTFISCGTEDPRHEYTSRQVAEVAAKGFHVEYHPYPGDHEWQPWRASLLDFMPRLFQENEIKNI